MLNHSSVLLRVKYYLTTIPPIHSELKKAFAHRHYNVVHWAASKPEKDDMYKEKCEIDHFGKSQPAMDGI